MAKRNKFREDRKEIVYLVRVYSKKTFELIKTIYTTQKPSQENGCLFDETKREWFKLDDN